MESIRQEENNDIPKYFSEYELPEIGKNYKNYIFPYKSQKWAEIKELYIKASTKEFSTLNDLQNVLGKINKLFLPNSKLISEMIKDNTSFEDYLLKNLFPFLCKCAADVEKLFPEEYPLHILSQNLSSKNILSRRQCLCLIAHMFFDTVLEQDNSLLPFAINYNRLLYKNNETIKTLFNYFQRVEIEDRQSREEGVSNLDTQYVSIVRISKDFEDEELFEKAWSNCTDRLCDVKFNEEGRIEDHPDAIQVDFANESLGGFFLMHTFTQEDIIFINSPELVPAVLFTELLLDKEAVLMIGAQRYSDYIGYLHSYKFKSDFVDTREVDKLGRKNSWITAIDALNLNFMKSAETSLQNILRELNKAYIGFKCEEYDKTELNECKPVSTGNWGTGAFFGDYELKFLIQWLACSRAGRDMIYSSFSNPNTLSIPNFITTFRKDFTVGKLFRLLIKNANKIKVQNNFKLNCFEILIQADK